MCEKPEFTFDVNEDFEHESNAEIRFLFFSETTLRLHHKNLL